MYGQAKTDSEIYLLIKYIKSVLWGVAKRLSYMEDARCLKVNTNSLYSPYSSNGNIRSWWEQSAVKITAFCLFLVSPFLCLSVSHYESWWKKKWRRI